MNRIDISKNINSQNSQNDLKGRDRQGKDMNALVLLLQKNIKTQ